MPVWPAPTTAVREEAGVENKFAVLHLSRDILTVQSHV